MSGSGLRSMREIWKGVISGKRISCSSGNSEYLEAKGGNGGALSQPVA